MKKTIKPESQMMGAAYDPHLSEGSAKVPIFQTSTFVFKNAEEGKSHFHIAYGLREKNIGESMSLAYSRINNPNLEIAEDRLKLWDKADACALFQSGMAAITTTILELTKPNSIILHSSPLYGGTDHFIEHVLPKYNIKSMYFNSFDSLEEIIKEKDKKFPGVDVSLVYIESPANPTNSIVDIKKSKDLVSINITQQEFNDLPHERGTVSMARSSDPNSANSQFFICFKPAPFLDRQYTVFGKVLEGMEFVDMIKRGDDNNNGAVSVSYTHLTLPTILLV